MRIPSWPDYSRDEIDAVCSVLESGRVNFWTGELCNAFETQFAAYCRARFGIAVANGTLGLDLALRAVGVGSGDEVIVTPRSFFASAGAIALLGATPVFADIDRDSQNITPATVKPLLTERTKAVVCVHLNGWPCDMPGFKAMLEPRGIAIVEDCAQAHGARFNDRPVGSWGDVGVFSFCQDKIISTGGEGGMVLTSREDLWHKMWSFRDHGKSYSAVHEQQHPPGFRWLHESFGSNYRMTEMQAAIGLQQLQKLDDWLRRRRANAAVVDKFFDAYTNVRLAHAPAHIEHAHYKHYLFVVPEALGEAWSRDRILDELTSRGVPGLSGSCPEIYREQAFLATSVTDPTRLPIARELGETSIQLLVHPTISTAEMGAMCGVVGEVLARAQR